MVMVQDLSVQPSGVVVAEPQVLSRPLMSCRVDGVEAGSQECGNC